MADLQRRDGRALFRAERQMPTGDIEPIKREGELGREGRWACGNQRRKAWHLRGN